MVKKKKLKLKDIKAHLESLPPEKPFGETDLDEEMSRPPRRKRVKDPDAEDLAFFPEPTTKKKKKKKVIAPKEVIMFPEKTNSETPKKSKLSKATKEIEKMQGKLSNLVKVPKEQLDTFMEVFTKASTDISGEFLRSIAPVFLSYEDAMNYSTVALRDGLSYDGEIDMEIIPLLEWSVRLNTLEVFLSKLTSMTEETRLRIIRFATIRAMDKAFNVKNTGLGMPNTHNKVAGIVTTRDKETPNKNLKALETVKRLNRIAKLAKEKNTPAGMPGAVQRKRYKT
jgi:hypothetical protein